MTSRNSCSERKQLIAAQSNLARVSHTPETIHLHPTAPLAEQVLLPGDPGRALLLAQSLLTTPTMFNHHRGLWGYTGEGPDGALLTIQSTGIGGPSAAIVVSELADLGARRLLRVGTCGALDSGLGLGELIVVSEALSADGTSRALGAGERATPSSGLLAALAEAAGDAARQGTVASTDLFYDARAREQEWLEAGALAVEMESAAVFALAAARELEAASLLLVTDVLFPERRRIEADALQAGEHRLGEVAQRALAELALGRS
jgi:uridine phosphorylase